MTVLGDILSAGVTPLVGGDEGAYLSVAAGFLDFWEGKGVDILDGVNPILKFDLHEVLDNVVFFLLGNHADFRLIRPELGVRSGHLHNVGM